MGAVDQAVVDQAELDPEMAVADEAEPAEAMADVTERAVAVADAVEQTRRQAQQQYHAKSTL